MYYGPAPWSEGFKRATKATRKAQGVDWSLSSGYRKVNDWDEKPGKMKTKPVRLYNGRTVQVPDADFEDFIGHWPSLPSDPFSEVGKYIDEAFAGNILDFDGVGHIQYVEYSLSHQLLRVQFAEETGGAVVVYFRVPKEVYSELLYLAKSGGVRLDDKGVERHLLGIRFWDIIRIRGQRTGGRYRYEYAIDNEYTGKGSAATRASSTITETLKDKAHDADKEKIDWINTFASRMLSARMKQQYDQLKTFDEKYKFMRRHGLDIDIDED